MAGPWPVLRRHDRGLRRADAGARSAPDARRLLCVVGAALFWAATTLPIKASRLNRISPEKVMLYQLVVSAPMLALAAWLPAST